MQELMNYAGNVAEELDEADMMSNVNDGEIRTWTAACGGAWTFFCC